MWVPHDTRDQIVDFVRCWSEKTEISTGRFPRWLGITASKFYDWRQRYGQANEHNGWVPRDFWLEAWEKQAIIDFHLKNPLEGYRRLAFMMLVQVELQHDAHDRTVRFGSLTEEERWRGLRGSHIVPQSHAGQRADRKRSTEYVFPPGTLSSGSPPTRNST